MLLECEKSFAGHIASVMKELAFVMVENASLMWFRGNVDDKTAVLEAGVGSTFMLMVDSNQRNKTQVAQWVDAAFFEH